MLGAKGLVRRALATVAANQARQRSAKVDAAIGRAERGKPAAGWRRCWSSSRTIRKPRGEVGKQISVLTDADQERVRDVGRAMQAGQAVDFAVWPGYVNREAFREALVEYADDAAELRSMADYLAEGHLTAEEQARLGAVVGTITDDTNLQITRMAGQREQLLAQARHGHGLTSMERAQTVCTIEDIDAGVIVGHKKLPELLFADERSKASVDFARTAEPAADLSNRTRWQITELVDASSTAAPHSREDQRLRFEVSSISDSVFSVAAGSPGNQCGAGPPAVHDQTHRAGQGTGPRGRGSGGTAADPGSRR
ncbi:hypothetical protein IU427_00895 [Nocardia beijingensis]|uniref:hypothetical protein n=1 Tax=Nocardia beijingensis TaxID=95162 RepID=UPI0018945EDA|nr:hypothetical protein [Nocardia beijingensis]MBF6463735.1 hypothetical protein [Nocardia beijingensis]